MLEFLRLLLLRSDSCGLFTLDGGGGGELAMRAPLWPQLGAFLVNGTSFVEK